MSVIRASRVRCRREIRLSEGIEEIGAGCTGEDRRGDSARQGAVKSNRAADQSYNQAAIRQREYEEGATAMNMMAMVATVR